MRSIDNGLGAQAAEASGKVQELQAELADAYKRLSKTSEELLLVNYLALTLTLTLTTLTLTRMRLPAATQCATVQSAACSVGLSV